MFTPITSVQPPSTTIMTPEEASLLILISWGEDRLPAWGEVLGFAGAHVSRDSCQRNVDSRIVGIPHLSRYAWFRKLLESFLGENLLTPLE